jgi:hypothetical protein
MLIQAAARAGANRNLSAFSCRKTQIRSCLAVDLLPNERHRLPGEFNLDWHLTVTTEWKFKAAVSQE